MQLKVFVTLVWDNKQVCVCWGERRELLLFQPWLNYILHFFLLKVLSGPREKRKRWATCLSTSWSFLLLSTVFIIPLSLPSSSAHLSSHHPRTQRQEKKKIRQMTNIAKQALKQPSGTVKFRCFRHALNALKKVALLYGQLQGCKGICCISEVLRSPFSSLL